MDSECTDERTVSTTDLVDALNHGIYQCIQSSGRVLPSSAISSSIHCQWTEYAQILDHDGSPLVSPAVEDLRPFFPPLDKNAVGSNGRTILYAACMGLLFAKRDHSSKKGKNDTPLFTFHSIASFLLDEIDVDPNKPTLTKGACHRVPLHLIARSCYPDALKLLLSRGADPSKLDDEGWTTLMSCCLPDIPSIDAGGPTIDEQVETAKILMTIKLPDGNNAVDINSRNYCGYTALHYACEGLNPTLIQCLLKEGGANASLRTIWGQSCIGIVKSESFRDPENATKCEGILISHLESTLQLQNNISLLKEELKVIELRNLIEDLILCASSHQEPSTNSDCEETISIEPLVAQDQRVLSFLLTYLKLDPSVLFDKNSFEKFPHLDQNLYESIHNRVLDLMPRAFLQVYCDRNPTKEEREVITCMNIHMREIAEKYEDGVRYIDSSILMNQSFCLHRERGHVPRQLEVLTDLIVCPLQRTFAFGIPSNAALKKIITYAPRIVEVGAGTGYWSYMLSKMGADVVAFDANPLFSFDHMSRNTVVLPSSKNAYFGMTSYFPVQKGDVSSIFDGRGCDLIDRALLLVWPNNPDFHDNPHVATQGSTLPEVWDAEILQKYYELGGNTVIYVGEREAKLNVMSNATAPDCGFCSSRKFQQFLQSNYQLKAELIGPKWWMKEDDITVWKRM